MEYLACVLMGALAVSALRFRAMKSRLARVEKTVADLMEHLSYGNQWADDYRRRNMT